MTKRFCFLLAAVLVYAAASFAVPSQKPLKVVATLPVLGDIAAKVGGNFVEVSSLAQPNQDPHFVIPTPTLMKKARSADIFIENGLSLELWAQKVVEGSANSKIQMGQPGHVVASRGVSTLEVPMVLSRALGDVHPGGNPHVWLDPMNAKIIAKNISQAYTKLDPAHAADYATLLTAFNNNIDVKMVEWNKRAAAIKGLKVITYHKSFVYFANRFGIVIPSEIEEKPGLTPSARHRDALIERMKSEKIDTLMLELHYDRIAADFIAGKTGARVIQVPIDVGADPTAKDYFSLIDLLINRLAAPKAAIQSKGA